MAILVYTHDHDSANRVQDIAELHGAKLVRGRSEANHDSVYEVSNHAIATFRSALSAAGYQHKFITR